MISNFLTQSRQKNLAEKGTFFWLEDALFLKYFFLRSAKNEKKNSSKRKHLFKAGSEEYVFLQLWHIPNCLYLLFSFFFLHLHSWTWRISVFVHSRELTYQRERDTVCEYMPALSIRLANKLMVYLQE